MITTNLTGGLGNYLFQIGAAETLAYLNDDSTIFKFDNSVGQAHKNINKYSDNILRKVNVGNPNSKQMYNEPGDFTFQKIPYGTDLVLNGYFQTEKHLDRDYILELYEIPELTKSYIENKYKHLYTTGTDYVSIHVRRGDYVNKQDRHPCQTMEYYNSAMMNFPVFEYTFKFLIFSDDIEWCKENFRGEQFIFIDGEEDYVHNIIANSTFSWWGTYLNTNIHKKVVAPTNWFGTGKRLKTENIYNDKWTVI